MKRIIFLLSVIAFLSSCAANRTYIRDYGQQIQLVKINFHEIYELYCRGAITIESVYTYDKDGKEQVHINYRYR